MKSDSYDLNFYFDPVCPFAWLTSRWVEMVAEQKNYAVDWRFISLRMLNGARDYAKEFPPEYEVGHNSGLRLLRMAAAIREDKGREAIGPLYTAISSTIFDVDRPSTAAESRTGWGTAAHVEPILTGLGLDVGYADALNEPSWDTVVKAETQEALSYAGEDVGTPVLVFNPPDGLGFFGPVISRLPDPEDAVALWDSVIHLASYPGFAELKRSLRERPQHTLAQICQPRMGLLQSCRFQCLPSVPDEGY